MNQERLQNFVSQFWDAQILPTLKDYITIPNKSPEFDKKWQENGHMNRVLELVKSWLEKHHIPGSTLHVGRIPGRTPLLLLEVPGTVKKNVLMYGHLDKQPEMTGWRPGLGPWTPVVEGDKLYGRGGADDGYAVFASVCALKALKEQNLPHPRVVVLIEFSEESGSPDLPEYLQKFEAVIGTPDLVVCLDSGAGDYERFWLTTSLRGCVGGTLKVEVLTEGVHSGDASGIVPTSFRIFNQLVRRVEDPDTGEILPNELKVEISHARLEQAKKAAKVLGRDVFEKFPTVEGLKPVTEDPADLILNRTWRPTLCYLGVNGMPACEDAGNVLRPFTEFKLSFRLPPTLSARKASDFLQKLLGENPPYGARVTASLKGFAADGWDSPELTPDLHLLINEVSQTYYRNPPCFMGEGGSIPFMAMLGKSFPKSQFIVTGVLGPHSNAHGPNEFLHIPYAKKLTSSLAHILTKYR